MPDSSTDPLADLRDALAADAEEAGGGIEQEAGASPDGAAEEAANAELPTSWATVDVRNLSAEERTALAELPEELIAKLVTKERTEIKRAAEDRFTEAKRLKAEAERQLEAAKFGQSIAENPAFLQRLAGQEAPAAPAATQPLYNIDFEEDPQGAEDQFVGRIADKLGVGNLKETIIEAIKEQMGALPVAREHTLRATAGKVFSDYNVPAERQQTLLNAYRQAAIARGKDPLTVTPEAFEEQLSTLAYISSLGSTSNGKVQTGTSPAAQKAAAGSVPSTSSAPTRKQTLAERLGRKPSEQEFLESDEGGVTKADLEEALRQQGPFA